MKGGRVSLSPRKVAQMMEQPRQRKEGDTNYANNQVWSHLEGRLLEKFFPDWIIAGAYLHWSTEIAAEGRRKSCQCNQI